MITPAKFRRTLLEWSTANPRSMPWTGENDPYKIWLSEIILQQTRVEQAAPYYYRLINDFPDLTSLAKTPLENLLKIWEGLGYYSRARNLHKSAEFLYLEKNGNFPTSYEEIRALKGVGDYTAAAISSFAFGIPKAVLDGNVIRILARVFGIEINPYEPIGKKYFQNLADKLLDVNQPGVYNQAVMNFGALVCTPQKPLCINCPLNISCRALNENNVSELPLKKVARPLKIRYFHYLVFLDKCGHTIIRQRKSKDIWHSLYEFPLFEFIKAKNLKKSNISNFLKESLKFKSEDFECSRPISLDHRLTHQQLHISFHIIQLSIKLDQKNIKDFKLVDHKKLKNFAVPKIIRLFLDQNIKSVKHAQ
ncbi:MAG: A/G-specific adenine glycosylase [Saprospiraceae bacterium]|nr:A/G-specific adenine glycosylase [Candidatus Vicinibacter affinis]